LLTFHGDLFSQVPLPARRRNVLLAGTVLVLAAVLTLIVVSFIISYAPNLLLRT
jgi:uncharacterized membrane protein